MGSNDFATILGIGVVGIGGYLFVTQIWPMMRDQLEGIGGGGGYEEERRIPPMIIEDRIPDYVVEDRYPDYNIIEDRYPDYYPYPYPQYYPYPVYNTPYCPPGRYWNGDRCKKIEIDCPAGYREDNGVCKPRRCDKDEVFDGWTCRKIPRIPKRREGDRPDWDWDRDRNNRPDWDRDRDGGREWDRDGRDRDKPPPRIPIPTTPTKKRKKEERPPERRFGSSRDKWNADREVEEKLKGDTKPSATPETDRVKEITEKAVQNFIEIWEEDYYY